MSIDIDEIQVLMAGGPERPSLAELLATLRPGWMKDARCKEHPDVNFFPARGQKTIAPRAVCDRCLVRCECLQFALDGELAGIWGGTSEQQRNQALRKGLDAAALLAELEAGVTGRTEAA